MCVAFFEEATNFCLRLFSYGDSPKRSKNFPQSKSSNSFPMFFLQGQQKSCAKKNKNKSPQQHFLVFAERIPLTQPTGRLPTQSQSHRIHTHLLHQLFDGTSVPMTGTEPSVWCFSPLVFRKRSHKGSQMGSDFFFGLLVSIFGISFKQSQSFPTNNCQFLRSEGAC